MLYEKKGRYIVDFKDIPTPRQHHFEIEVDERRGNNNEVELGFDEERALREAKRCLSCRRCLGCALCWAECKPEAINFEMEDEVFDLEADEVIIAPGVERPQERIDRKFGKHQNLITDTQLERMLSAGGPTEGLVIRPYDGEVPKRIAFVQSYDSAAEKMHEAALFLGINEAILARKKLADAEIEFFGSNLEGFLKEHEQELKGLDRIRIEEKAVTKIESLEDQSLKLGLGADGSEGTRQFDLVVLITQPQVSKDAKDLSKGLGLELAYAGFLADGGKGLISTDKEAVKFTAVA